jgi:dsRNA-specific ribonuclease
MKKIVKLTESDLSRIVNRVVSENIGDKTGDLYSDINKLIDMEYSELETDEVIDVLENILDSLKGRSERKKRGGGYITPQRIKGYWGTK